MIKNNEILFTKSLHRKFIKCVQEVEGVDCSKYRSLNLKTRLKSTFPTLVIHRSFTKNTIDLVHSQSLTAKELVQTAVGSDTLCTDTDIGSSEGAGEAQRFSHENAYLHTLFNASTVLYTVTLTMKKSHGITAALAINFRWLILADCLTNEPVIFNHPLCSSYTRTLIPWPVESLLWLR